MKYSLICLLFFTIICFLSKALACHMGDFESTAKGHHKWGEKVGFFQLTENTTITSATSTSCDIYTTFLENQYDFIQEQVAHGSGPHLDALVVIAGCDDQVRSEFSKILRSNYEKLFPDGKNPQALRIGIEKLIVSNSILKLSCPKV